MPYLTVTEKAKATTKPWFGRLYDIQSGNGMGLFWDTKHTHMLTYLLTCQEPIWGDMYYNVKCINISTTKI